MLEKLLLAVTITFSLNLFLQVRTPNQTNIDASYQQQVAKGEWGSRGAGERLNHKYYNLSIVNGQMSVAAQLYRGENRE